MLTPDQIVYNLMVAGQAAIVQEAANIIMEIQNNVRTQEAVRNAASTKTGTATDAGQDGSGSEQPPVPPVL